MIHQRFKSNECTSSLLSNTFFVSESINCPPISNWLHFARNQLSSVQELLIFLSYPSSQLFQTSFRFIPKKMAQLISSQRAFQDFHSCPTTQMISVIGTWISDLIILLVTVNVYRRVQIGLTTAGGLKWPFWITFFTNSIFDTHVKAKKVNRVAPILKRSLNVIWS